jgi:hypothetical protein
VLSLTAADTFWLVGMPIDVLVHGVRAAWQAPDPFFAVAVLVLPAIGGLLAPAVASRSGRGSPRLPVLVAIAVGIVTVALAVYGLTGSALVAWDLVTSTTTWSQLRAGWAVTGWGLVALAWLVCLGVAAVGHRTARTRPERCDACTGG